MATTFIKPIKNKSYMKEALNYAMDEKKTDGGLYNTGLNCEFYFANEQFKEVREKFEKNKGIVGYHLTQNFEESVEKLSPEIAHEIGIKLAEKMFPHFQVTISTHVNTEHVHNHIIINAVSYKDGRKYYDNDKNKQKIREISDLLCEEYGVSVLEKTKKYQRFYRKDRNKYTKLKATDYRNTDKYVKWKAEHLDRNEIMKNDIDIAIEQSKSFNEFIDNMKMLGYEIKYENRQHIKFKFPGAKNFRKGYVLGNEYTENKIRERIEVQQQSLEKEVPDTADYKKFDNHKFALYFDMQEVNRILYKAENEEEVYKNNVYIAFVKDIKKVNHILYSMYKKNPTFEYNPDSHYFYREQKAIERINVAIKNIHSLDEYRITNSEKMQELYTGIENKKNKLGESIKKLKKEMDIVNKKIVAIKKYNHLLEIKNDENGIDEKEMNELKNYLSYYNLLEENAQEDFILKAESYNNKFEKISNEYEKICIQYREISMLKNDFEQVQKEEKQRDEHSR